MTPRTFDVKFPCGTQFIFESLTFTTGEDGNLRMLPLRPAQERITLMHGQDPWSLATVIFIRRCLLKSESFYRALHSHHQDRSGYSGGDFCSSAIVGSIRFVIIDNVPQTRFIW
jgi:hypothetical protein